MVKLSLIFASLAVTLAITGCGGGSTRSPRRAASSSAVRTTVRTVGTTTETIYIHRGPVSAANTRHIEAKKLPFLGWVLVNGDGRTLYAFVAAAHRTGACTGPCAAVWPPMRLTIEGTFDAAPSLREELVTSEADPEGHRVGDRVVKFAGRVVHTYVGDYSPGVANGEGLESNGGHWYVISPSGNLIVKDQASSAARASATVKRRS
jgi:predicted lipoprotein with Yx(FWY)xxD motif